MNIRRLYKISILFITCLFLLVVGIKTIFAAGTVSLFMANWINLGLNEVSYKLPAITVTDEGGGNITATYGVNIMLPKDADILWDKNVKQLTANGVTVDVNYDKTLKTLNIPVFKTFVAGETLVITGHAVMTYSNGSSYKNLTLDINGDNVSDATGNNGLQLDATLLRTDQSPPFPINSLSYKTTDTSVVLSWENPPDPDLYTLVLTRTFTRGTSAPISTDVVIDKLTSTYTDAELQAGDKLQYSIVAKDNVGNLSEPVTILVEIPVPVIPAVSSPEENVPLPAIESETAGVERTGLLDSITEEDINNVLSKYSDLNKDSQYLKEIVYFVKSGAIKGTGKKLKSEKQLNYKQFSDFAVKAFSIEKKGSYFNSLKVLGHISPKIKPHTKIKKKSAFKILLKLKGIDYKTQTIVDKSTLKGHATLADIVVWSIKIIDQGS